MEQASSEFSTGVPALAAIPQLAGNSRQGFGPVASTMRWASGWAISSSTLGLSTSLYDGDAGSRSTGKERDAECGLDYFTDRYYGSNMGRMMSPDPMGGDMTSPQSLNKYAYALNNPLTNTDPTGLYVCASGQDCSAFEKALDALRNSKNGDVARAAGAYGALGDKNGVTVGFADLSNQGEDGKVTSTLGADDKGNLQAQSNVTINTGATGASFDAAIGH
jgi:RHS repeat-associated protein